MIIHWQRQAQENEGEKYFFNGNFYCTHKVHQELTEQEIIFIYLDVMKFVQANYGIDYLQIYKDNRNLTLYFIDNLNEEQLNSDNYNEEDNYCTLLFADEY
jgi:hypothetical protein